jgi:hypothetical protein
MALSCLGSRLRSSKWDITEPPVAPENIHGVDTDSRAVVLCQFLGLPGQFIQTQPGAPSRDVRHFVPQGRDQHSRNSSIPARPAAGRSAAVLIAPGVGRRASGRPTRSIQSGFQTRRDSKVIGQSPTLKPHKLLKFTHLKTPDSEREAALIGHQRNIDAGSPCKDQCAEPRGPLSITNAPAESR